MHGLQGREGDVEFLRIVDEWLRGDRQIALHDADEIDFRRRERGIGRAVLFGVHDRVEVVGRGVAADIELHADLEEFSVGSRGDSARIAGAAT